MLLSVLNAAATPQTEIVRGQETPVDLSGTFGAITWQVLAEANPLRSGAVLQNVSPNPVYVFESPDEDTVPVDASAWIVQPGAYWPPPGFPTTVGPIWVRCDVVGSGFVAREW